MVRTQQRRSLEERPYVEDLGHHHHAALHHERAAYHYKQAAKYDKAEEHEKAAHDAFLAHGHNQHAIHHDAEAAKLHAGAVRQPGNALNLADDPGLLALMKACRTV